MPEKMEGKQKEPIMYASVDPRRKQLIQEGGEHGKAWKSTLKQPEPEVRGTPCLKGVAHNYNNKLRRNITRTMRIYVVLFCLRFYLSSYLRFNNFPNDVKE